MRRYKGKGDILLRIEHRLTEEEMEEQVNREAKEGGRLAAGADERGSSEDRKHTSGGVFNAVNSNLGAGVGDEKGAVASIPGKEGRIT